VAEEELGRGVGQDLDDRECGEDEGDDDVLLLAARMRVGIVVDQMRIGGVGGGHGRLSQGIR
jgi:hypothetical protein